MLLRCAAGEQGIVEENDKDVASAGAIFGWFGKYFLILKHTQIYIIDRIQPLHSF